MGCLSKSFAVVFLIICIPLLIFSQNARALTPSLTLNATEVTQRSVTLTWTQSHFLPSNFQNYELYIVTDSAYSNSSKLNGLIWSTSDRGQLNTTVHNLSPSSQYSFYVKEHDAYGQTDGSNTIVVQTLPIPTPSPSPVPSPTIPEFPAGLAIGILITATLASALIFRSKTYQIISR
jgi:hypothetical protein